MTKEELLRETNIEVFKKRAERILSEELDPIAHEVSAYYEPRKVHRLFKKAKERAIEEMCWLFRPKR